MPDTYECRIDWKEERSDGKKEGGGEGEREDRRMFGSCV